MRNLNKAFKRVVQVKGTGFPKFKKKNEEDSFYLEGSLKISGYWVKLPRIGWVKSHEQLQIVNLQNVTISKRAGDWYIAFKIDVEPQTTPKVRERIGVDVGIKTLATLLDGTTYPNPKAYRPGKKKLAQLQKELYSSPKSVVECPHPQPLSQNIRGDLKMLQII
ncbi:MAG: RNA-guided endonuclease InsQ/TnpB family protein [Chroococcales cyanobacterium]